MVRIEKKDQPIAYLISQSIFFFFRFFYHQSFLKKSTMSYNISDSSSKNIGGRPLKAVWNHFTRGDEKAKGKYQARCNYCDKSWERGEPCELEIHLANHCTAAPNEVIREYLAKLLSHNPDGSGFNNKNNKRKQLNLSGQKTLDDFAGSSLEIGKVEKINQAWAKAFTVCGIPWRVVENPFFIEALKEMNPSYEPPTRELLSGRIFEQQLARVNNKVKNILIQQKNLTLGM